MKSTVIECPECAGHGGEGVYCEDCLSTGRITVYGPPAEVIDQLRAELAAAVGRAEAAEARAALWKRAAKRWRGKAYYERARRKHDSVDAYNARISEALRSMAESEAKSRGEVQP